MTNDAANEWGVPDWIDRALYQRDTKELSLDMWRWEFLRRDNNYRRSWNRKGKNEETNAVNAGAFDLPYFINPSLKALELKDALRFVRTDEGTQLHDIRCSIIKFFSKEKGHALDNEFFTSHFRSLFSDPEKAVFAFDLTKPLEPQVERASIALDALQLDYRDSIAKQLRKKKMPRRGSADEIPEVWLRQIPPNLDHLRILDARAKKVPFAEIGRVIFNDVDYDAAAIRASREYSYARIYWRMT